MEGSVRYVNMKEEESGANVENAKWGWAEK